MLQSDQTRAAGEFLMQRFIGISPLVLVQLFGITWAIICLRDTKKRAPATSLLIGLGLLTLTLVGRPFID